MGDRRISEHRNKLRQGKHTNNHLQSSWNKHGEDYFRFEIIEEVDNPDIIIEREQYWIDFYKGIGEIFNIRKIADRNTGINHSPETISKLREISIEYFDKNVHKSVYNFWEKKYGDIIANRMISDMGNKISTKMRGENNHMYGRSGILNPNLKKIYQLSRDGEFIKEWEGIIIASKDLSIHSQNISECCLGKRKTAGGFIWKYKNNKI